MNLDLKELTKSILALLIVGGAITSLFIQIANPGNEQVLRVLAGAVIGYYFGAGTFPTFGVRKQVQ